MGVILVIMDEQSWNYVHVRGEFGPPASLRAFAAQSAELRLCLCCSLFMFWIQRISEGRRKQGLRQREKRLDLFAVYSWMRRQWWRPNVRTACVVPSLRFSQDSRLLPPPFAHNENIKLMSRIVLFFLSPSKSAEENQAGNRRSAFLVKNLLS